MTADEERRRKAREATARYRANHPERVKADRQAQNERLRASGYLKQWHAEVGRWRMLERKYGVTRGWYEQTLANQGGGCAICGVQAEPDGRMLAVDHDHETGAPRGVLCNRCNRAIGQFADDPDRLVAAAAYLLTTVDILGKVG